MSARIVGLLTACVFTAASASPAQDAGQDFDSAGVQIHYVDQGDGEPVVLVHGFTGSYARHWEAPGGMEALRRAGYRVIALDCRGHGQSGTPQDPSQYGLEMVRDVVRLLDHLDVQRAHVVGYSMGGQIASQLLVHHPDRLLTATLVGAGWEGEDLEDLAAQTQELAAAFADRDAGPLLRLMTPPGQPEPTDDEVAAVNASLFGRNDPEVLAAMMRSLLQLSRIPADSLRANKVPTLALVGEHDPRVEEVERLAGVMANLEVIEIPGATHATSVRLAAEDLLTFLDKHRSN